MQSFRFWKQSRPKVDDDGRTILLVIGIGLVVAAVLHVGRVGVERHQLLEHPVVHGQLNDRPARDVPAHNIAVIEEVVQKRSGLGSGSAG